MIEREACAFSACHGRKEDSHLDPVKIVMTLLIRDDLDILTENLLFHHEMGVDSFILMDGRPSGDSADLMEILPRDLGLDIRHASSALSARDQWVAEMTRLALDTHAADWVLNGAPDMFWVPRQGTLRTLLAGLSPGTDAIRTAHYGAVVVCDGGEPLAGNAHPRSSILFERSNREGSDRPRVQNLLHRSYGAVQLQDITADEDSSTEAQISILHYPYRSLEQFARRIEPSDGIPVPAPPTQEPSDDSSDINRFWIGLARAREEAQIGLLSGQLVERNTVADILMTKGHHAQQEHLKQATEKLVIQTRALVDAHRRPLVNRIAKMTQPARWKDPLYYNLRFVLSGPETHLRWIEKLSGQEKAEDICADFPAFRDAFSLFPRNAHVRPYLKELLSLTHAPDIERLHEDCAGKRVILHTSCHPRLPASEETVASFAPLQDRYHHIILFGQDTIRSENETPLSFSYDGRFLQVPTPDNYESLHRKLFYAYMLCDLLAAPALLIKIDDNLMLEDPSRFETCIDKVTEQGAAYAGRKVGMAQHSEQLHGWHISKCADPVIETRGYQYPLPRSYAAGGYGYVLNQEGVAACAYMYLAMKAFFDMQAIGLEDACVGHAMYTHGIDLLDISAPDNLLALPGLTTKERWRLMEARKGI